MEAMIQDFFLLCRSAALTSSPVGKVTLPTLTLHSTPIPQILRMSLLWRREGGGSPATGVESVRGGGGGTSPQHVSSVLGLG